VHFFEADALNLSETLPSYDIIVSNPPYIKLSEAEQIHPNVKDHEPHLALFVKQDDAIIFYKRIIDFCVKHLNANGYLFFELNPLTAEEVKTYAQNKNMFSKTELLKDMSGNVRFFKGVK
jgi:release factor glutamine methyltransferase